LLTRLLGLTVVDRAGAEIGRGRSLVRTLVAWSPIVAWLASLGVPPTATFLNAPGRTIPTLWIVIVIMAAGATWTILRRTRGPHDRLVGTWVVPK
jgi:hypothetical protein